MVFRCENCGQHFLTNNALALHKARTRKIRKMWAKRGWEYRKCYGAIRQLLPHTEL